MAVQSATEANKPLILFLLNFILSCSLKANFENSSIGGRFSYAPLHIGSVIPAKPLIIET